MTDRLRIALVIVSLLTAPICGHAQYQLLNPGFESWEGTATNSRPSHWSSFPQADGSWAWAASTAQHYHRNGGRPGSSGSSYLTIYSRSVLGVVATGRLPVRATTTILTEAVLILTHSVARPTRCTCGCRTTLLAPRRRVVYALTCMATAIFATLTTALPPVSTEVRQLLSSAAQLRRPLRLHGCNSVCPLFMTAHLRSIMCLCR